MIVLETAGIRKEYGTLVAVNDVNLSIDKGNVVGLIGPNGAGKTTLLRMLATLLYPTSGHGRLFGFDLVKDRLNIRERIGFLPDFFNLYRDLTLCECLEFFARAYKVESGQIAGRINDVLKYVDLDSKRKDFIRNLSRGMVQRLGLAALLVHSPDVLLLDEPASGLDPKARLQLRDLLQKLRQEGKTIIISSHILAELSSFCTHIAIMNKGHIVMYGGVGDIQQKTIGSRRIVVSVLNDCEKAVSFIKKYPNSKIMAVQDNRITVDIIADKEEIASLNAGLVASGVKVAEFYEEKINLEDLFMKISSNEGM